LVSRGVGRIFMRSDKRYFIYLPKALAEDTAFPFQTSSSERVRIHFKPGEKRLVIEK